jgi:F-type H+-transporting ATPase subunit delta
VSHSQSEIRAISKRYVSALFAIAENNTTQDQLSKDLETIAHIIGSNRELASVLTSPIYSRVEKMNVVTTLLKKLKTSETLATFVSRLAKNDRLVCLPVIASLYKEHLLKLRGIVSVEVTSAKALSDAQTKTIISAVEKASKATVTAEFVQNAEILGGVIIRQGSQLLDFSLRGKLQRLETSLKASVVHG